MSKFIFCATHSEGLTGGEEGFQKIGFSELHDGVPVFGRLSGGAPPGGAAAQPVAPEFVDVLGVIVGTCVQRLHIGWRKRRGRRSRVVGSGLDPGRELRI